MPAGGKGRAADTSQVVETAGRVLLLALPLVLPFEVPLFGVGPLVITSAELVLYLLIAVWAAGRVSAGRRPPGPTDWLGRAVIAWLAVTLLAAVLAPALRAEAIKSALRAVGGGLLFFAARDLARSAPQARAVTLAVVAGALLSAGSALLELWIPASAPLWRPFHVTGFTAGGLARASGSFAYPTIAAMYWEAALPLVVALAAGAWPARRARWVGLLATAASALLVGAILASATRTALVGAAVASAAMLAFTWRAGPAARLAGAGTVAAVVVLVAATLLPPQTGSLSGQRLRFWNDGAWYRARYGVSTRPLTIPAGEEVEVPVTVTNTGSLTWPARGPQAVNLSYHWETTTAAGQPRLEFDGRRTPLPRDVPPGESVALQGLALAPLAPGRYRLRWDLVREQVTWFSERGTPTADQTVDVVPGSGTTRPRRPRRMVASSLEAWVAPSVPGRRELWWSAVQLWRRHPLLGIGPDNFRRRYPEVLAARRPGHRLVDQRLHANNFYLETLAGQGLLGLLALGALAVALARALRARLAEGDLLATAAAVGAATFFIHGLLDYFLPFTPTYALWWLLLALASAKKEERGVR
jgi:hypothetical protein